MIPQKPQKPTLEMIQPKIRILAQFRCQIRDQQVISHKKKSWGILWKESCYSQDTENLATFWAIEFHYNHNFVDRNSHWGLVARLQEFLRWFVNLVPPLVSIRYETLIKSNKSLGYVIPQWQAQRLDYYGENMNMI